MKYVSVKEMVRIEKAADAAGHTYPMMMEHAGRGLAEVIQDRYGNLEERTITALVGSGNNGGDALVALDYLLQWGWTATAVLLRKREEADPLMERVHQNGGHIVNVFDPDQAKKRLKDKLLGSRILLDGVLGTGIKLPLRKPLDHLLEMTIMILAQVDQPPLIVAVDCPSGIDCDSGEVSPTCIAADMTVTMAAVKQGLLKYPAYDYLGSLVMVGIGLPPNLPEVDAINREVIQGENVLVSLPPRPGDAHKGTFGTSLVISGSDQYPGAAILSGQSAHRIGSGMVTMAVPEGIYGGLIKSLPEATWIKLDEVNGGIAPLAADIIKSSLGRPTACLIGPGLGTNPQTGEFLIDLLQISGLPPLVIDADGLRLLSENENWRELIPAGSVLTPHPGEMSALTGLTVDEIQENRLEIAERFASEWNQVVLLKGAHTVIASPGGLSRILIGADPALARAGSGDVLAGIITGLIAQGMDEFDAAVAGAWIHLRAGQLAEKQQGSAAAVLAGDISEAIGWVLRGE